VSSSGQSADFCCTMHLRQASVRTRVSLRSGGERLFAGVRILDDQVEPPKFVTDEEMPPLVSRGLSDPMRQAISDLQGQRQRQRAATTRPSPVERLNSPASPRSLDPPKAWDDGRGSSNSGNSAGAPGHKYLDDGRGSGNSAGAWMQVVPSIFSDLESSVVANRISLDSSLWFSESSGGRSRTLRPPSKRNSGAQTEAPTEAHPEVADAAVNTDVVMDAFSFRCTACSKPPTGPRFYDAEGIAPVVPGPEAQAIMHKLDRKKGVRRESSPHSIVCGRPEFNGIWEAVTDQDSSISDWLMNFQVLNGRVILGDDSEVCLEQVRPEGAVFLCGGKVHLRPDGALVRVGRSGVQIEFRRLDPSVYEGTLGSDE